MYWRRRSTYILWKLWCYDVLCAFYSFRFPHARPFFHTFSKGILVISCIGCLLQAVAAEALPAAVMVGALCCPCKFTAIIICYYDDCYGWERRRHLVPIEIPRTPQSKIGLWFRAEDQYQSHEQKWRRTSAMRSAQTIHRSRAKLQICQRKLRSFVFAHSKVLNLAEWVWLFQVVSSSLGGGQQGRSGSGRTVHDLIRTLHQSQTLEAAEKEWRQRWAAGPVASVELRIDLEVLNL